MKTPPLYCLLFLAALLILNSCEKDQVYPSGGPSVGPSISLKNLEVGQQFKYQEIRVDFVTGSETEPLYKECYYGDDLLIFEVIKKTEEGVVIKEYLSTQTVNDVGAQLLRIKGDNVDVELLDDPSKYGPSLFHQKSFNITPLIAPVGALEEDCFYPDLTNVGGDGLPPGYAVEAATINGVNYTQLFAYRFDGAMAVDGPGYTYLFSHHGAIIRSTTYGGFFPFLKGWELTVD